MNITFFSSVSTKEKVFKCIPEIKKHNVKFIKVKGHSDNKYNNRCDELARNAIEDFK